MSQRRGSASSAHESPITVRVPTFTFTLGVHSPHAVIPRHSHDSATVCYVLRGRFSEYSAGAVADCVSETLKVTPAGEVHWNSFADTETRGLRIEIDRAYFADSPSIRRMLDTQMLLRRPSVGELARHVIHELKLGDASSEMAVEGLALQMVAELAREVEAEERGRNPAWLRVADELVRQCVPRNCTVAEIARVAGVSPTTLAREYRRRFGCTVGERLRRLRIEAAARALRETNNGLSEIALTAGFYDQSHFSNVFRRYMGQTPAKYRAQRSSLL